MSSPFGSLKNLLLTLQAAPSLSGVSVVYGEEFVESQAESLPSVKMVPVGGDFQSPGYIRSLDPSIEITWSITETIELHLWAVSSDPNNQNPIDHADAIEDLRAKVLQALQFQRAPDGLFYRPVSGRWEQMDGSIVRFGRGYILSVVCEIGIPDVTPVEATVVSETITIPT